MRPWVVALGLMVASAPALAQELSYGQSVLDLLTPNPFPPHPLAPLRAAPVPMPPTPPPRAALPAPAALALAPATAVIWTTHAALDTLIAAHARANGVPEALVHRVIKRESRYDPRAVGLHGAMGLMQIKHATARALGYTGPAAGLLDPETNLTYAVRYLAGAFRAAQGNTERAYALYRSGYYTAKRRTARAAEHAVADPQLRGAQ
jgi:soluble lytic murein transglycosylase-like protein